MPLNFTKVAAAKAAPAQTNPQTATHTAAHAASKTTGPVKSLIKYGKQAQDEQAKETVKNEARKAEYDLMWRFRLNDGEERKITFLDGSLTENGVIEAPCWHEHTLNIGGKFPRYTCTESVEPCPICASGDVATFVRCLTVIDHTPHTIQNGANAGKEIKNTRKLFVMKQGTWDLLALQATKRNGLAGITYEVSRHGDKSPNVGSAFDFVEKFDSPEDLAKKYHLALADVEPADYNAELPQRSAEELIALGVGKALKGPGYEKKSYTSNADKDDLADEM